MKFNHFCLLIGIFLVVLSLSVFANAASINLDCSSPFNCEIKSYCEGVNEVPALLGIWGNCGPDGTQCDYPFISQNIGKHLCNVTVKTTAYGNSPGAILQNNETVSVKINGIIVGTTIDRYANTPSPPNTVWCGIDSQTFSNEVELNQNNTIDIISRDSMGVVAVIIDCQPLGNDCSTNLGPIIDPIENKTIKYTENFNLDLWDYVSDYDDFPNELIISTAITGNSVNCTLDSNRFLKCNATQNLGVSVITISAKDECNKTFSKEFSVNVTNSPPSIYVPDKIINCTQDLNAFIDLYNHSSDENKYSLNYQITSQSNPYFANCYIDRNHFISCSLASCNDGVNNITVRATDIFGLYKETTFKLSIANSAPTWKDIPAVCINESKTKFIDLRNYASDIEDKNNLTFSLTQNSINGLSCSLVDSNFISCTLTSNISLSNVLDLTAFDSKGASAKKSLTISSNCFDGNGVIIFEAETYGVCLEQCSTYSIPMTLKNKTNARKCFDFDSESTPYNYLSSSISQSNFCLNSNEETNLTLSVNACGAEERKYFVDVFDNDSNLSMRFEFEVGNCNNFDGFKIEEFDGTICEGESKEVSVLVKNTSLVTKKIFLGADNEMVLPHFDREYINLNAGEQKIVQLTINASGLRSGTTELISLSGDAENYHIEKDLYFDVVNCSEIIKRTFSLSAPSVCFDVRRGQKFESQFSIRRESNVGDNCSTTRKDYFLNIFGATSELSYNTVSLKEGEGKTILYSLIVPESFSAGRNYITINATDGLEWNSYTQNREICLNVLPQSSSSFYVRTQSKDIIWCGSNIFEVEVVNNGDLDENYSLSAFDYPSGVSVSFSENSFIVRKGTSKIIYVSVSTNTTSRVADNQKIQLKLIGSTELTSTIYFNIKEKTTFDDIQILSATNEINMSGNSTSPFNLVIRNNSESTLRNILISIESLPEGVTMQEITIDSLSSGQPINISGEIIAKDVNGEFVSVFVVSSGQLVNKKSFALNIEKSNGVFAGMFTAFFSFGSNAFGFGGLFGLIFLVIILIVLLWLITLGIALLTTPKQREVWME
jgi:hypothetical protein